MGRRQGFADFDLDVSMEEKGVEKSDLVKALESTQMPDVLKSYVLKTLLWKATYTMSIDVLNFLSEKIFDDKPVLLRPVIVKTVETAYEIFREGAHADNFFDVAEDEYTKYWVSAILFSTVEYNCSYNLDLDYPELPEFLYKLDEEEKRVLEESELDITKNDLILVGASYGKENLETHGLGAYFSAADYKGLDYKEMMTQVTDIEREGGKRINPVIESIIDKILAEANKK